MLARAAREADRLGGVDVAPNTFVVVAPWLIQRHRKLWERPDAFDPARFLPGAREKIDRYAYLPFGAGPRVCIGQSFAMQEAMVALIAALRAYEFAPMGPEPDPLHRITLKFRGPLRLAITPR
jgi:cytochrome P450